MFTKSLLAAALVATASAHQNLRAVFINDASPGPYIGIRMPPSNSPVTDLTSTDMACNVPSTSGGAVKTLDAAAGDSIKVQWDQSGHPGPITHYVLPVKDAASATGAGAGWVKIDELDYVGGKWASEIMGAANMTHEFKLPAGLASGEYLLRSEMLALHSSQTLGGAQFYIGCVQLKVTGTGSGTCGPSISIPGAYKASDEDIFIPKYYNGFDATTYKAPGGPVGSCGGASDAEPATPTTSGKASASASVVAKVTATPTPAAPAASSTPAPVESSAPVASSSPIASPSPIESSAPAPSSGAGNDLPKEFTIKTFIAWLEGKAGNASRARRHARAF